MDAGGNAIQITRIGKDVTTERAYWLAWAQVPRIGSVLLKRIQQQFGSLAQAWQASPADLAGVDGISLLGAEAIARAVESINPDTVLAQHEEKNRQFWTPADPNYPRLLFEIADPPAVLYYRGVPCDAESEATQPSIGVVGTRDPSEYGRRWTQRLTRSLTFNGFTVVSGLASGIDAIAHRTCLQHQGRTIAVLGTGVDQVYPRSNQLIYDQILATGLIVSEYPDGTPPDRAHFPRRNRIIAGLSRATLVMEGSERSGAMITARLANDYGRDVYVLPGTLDTPQAQGCLKLIQQGAQVILGEAPLIAALSSMPDVHWLHAPPPAAVPSPSSTSASSLSRHPAPTSPATFDHLSPELQTVLAVISTEAMSFDAIVQQVDLATGTVLSALTQLEILGAIAELPGKQYHRI